MKKEHCLIEREHGKAFKCYDENCTFSTDLETTLRNHKLVIHQKVVRFRCNLCDYKTFYNQNALHHIRVKHPGLEGKPLKINCNLCQQREDHDKCEKSTTGPGFDRKRKVIRTTGVVQCPECESVFNSQSLRRKHFLANHPTKTIFQCGHCQYGSNYLSNLQDHVSSRHENKRLVCDLCGYTATWGKQFHQHRRDRHGLRQKKAHGPRSARSRCQVCGRRVGSLAEHMRAHLVCND